MKTRRSSASLARQCAHERAYPRVATASHSTRALPTAAAAADDGKRTSDRAFTIRSYGASVRRTRFRVRWPKAGAKLGGVDEARLRQRPVTSGVLNGHWQAQHGR